MKIVRSAIWGLAASVLFAGRGTAQSSEEEHRSYLWKQCDEDVLVFYVDREPLERMVPPGHSLALEDGKASVLIAAQNCPTYWFDGEEIGETFEVHHWVAIHGKADVRDVAGAERTLPTMTWFALFTGSTNPRSRERWNEVRDAFPRDRNSIARCANARGERQGFPLRTDWSTRGRRSEGNLSRKMVGVNHDVYSTDSKGSLVYNRIQCLGSLFAWESEGSLKVSGGTEPSKAIGTGTYPAAVHTFLPIWCRASLADSAPRVRLDSLARAA